MLSTIRTIFTFNKKLTLGLPSALTWVFLYNHEGPRGVILFSLEMMIIKKHLLSDFSSIWLSLPLWTLFPSGHATGFSIFFLCITGEFLCSVGESQHTAVQLLFTARLVFLRFIYGREKQHSPLFSVLFVDVLASSGQVNGCLSPQFVCPSCEVWTPVWKPRGEVLTGWL